MCERIRGTPLHHCWGVEFPPNCDLGFSNCDPTKVVPKKWLLGLDHPRTDTWLLTMVIVFVP